MLSLNLFDHLNVFNKHEKLIKPFYDYVTKQYFNDQFYKTIYNNTIKLWKRRIIKSSIKNASILLPVSETLIKVENLYNGNNIERYQGLNSFFTIDKLKFFGTASLTNMLDKMPTNQSLYPYSFGLRFSKF